MEVRWSLPAAEDLDRNFYNIPMLNADPNPTLTAIEEGAARQCALGNQAACVP